MCSHLHTKSWATMNQKVRIMFERIMVAMLIDMQLFLYNVINVADSEGCKDVYVYNKDICELPSPSEVEFLEHYHDTTAKVCEGLCTELEPERCFGIFYNVTNQICSLSSYTESSSTNDCQNTTGLLYFRRNQCLGEYNYFITKL